MKRKMMMCGVVLVLGLLALGCGDAGGTPSGGGGALDGTTWTGGGRTLTFADGGYTMEQDNGNAGSKGTYSVSGSTIYFTQVEEKQAGTWSPNDGDYSGTVSNNTITAQVWGVTFAKQGGSGNPGGGGGQGANPYTGTTWDSADNPGKTLKFNSDTFSMDDPSGNDDHTGTYTVSGNTITFRVNGQTLGTATVNGNTLKLSGGGETYTKRGGGGTPGGSNPPASLSGTTWRYQSGTHVQTVTFTSNNTLKIFDNQNTSMNNVSGTYTYSSGSGTLRVTISGETVTTTVTGNSMTMSGWTYIKYN